MVKKRRKCCREAKQFVSKTSSLMLFDLPERSAMMGLPTFNRHFKREIWHTKCLIYPRKATKQDNVSCQWEELNIRLLLCVQISGSLSTNKWFAVLTNATKDMFTQLPLCVLLSGSLRTVKWFDVLTNATKDMFTQFPLCVQISGSLRTNKWFAVLTNATKDMLT